jgi:hypothetical protein
MCSFGSREHVEPND